MATEEKKPAASGGGGGSKLLPAMLALNSVLVAGVLAMLVLKPGGAKTAAAPAEHAAEKSEGGHGSEKKAEGEKKPEGEHGEKSEHDEKKAEGEKKEGGHGSEGHAEAVNAPAGSPTLKLPDFTVRLRNPEADRYARITFEVQVAGEIDKTNVETHLPQVRDAFLSYLSDRTLEELRGSEGIEKTKQALLDRMPRVAPGAKVLAIYVTDMVVQ
ncbi:MAG TPA: flagellar basal body-associated FliL family protein [Myxococcales bacterium]|nr:flagellar basal body-associated FliL family protein [Myxococcales bacterium]